MAAQVEQLRWTAQHHGDELAYRLVPDGPTLTFAEWDATADRLAHALLVAGVSAGDRIVLHLENEHLCRWLPAYAGIHRAGAVAVPTNVRLTAKELGAIVANAEPVGAITSSALQGTVDSALAGTHLRFWLEVDDDAQWEAALAHGEGPVDHVIDEGDLADLMYTSGTTGLPKGVAVRHRNTHLIPNGEPPWSGDAWIHCSPLSTFAGISFVYNPMKMGMTAIHLPRFDVDRWIDAVEQYRPTCAFLVPAMVQLLLAHPRTATADLSSLTLVSIGSASLPPNIHQAFAERLPDAIVTNNYSMTEAGTAFTYLPPGELAKRPGSVGMPMPPTEIRIGGDDGEPLPAGEVGEVLIKVGEHHREYYKDPEATARTWSGEWLRSGDLGKLDEDGYLYIVGRAKDIVIRGGNNIAATEVEHVLYEHPAVLEAAVIGVPHEVLGEDVGAFVVLRPDAELAADDTGSSALITYCREHLADYKVPRHLWFTDALPRNATGKVVKRDLVPPA